MQRYTVYLYLETALHVSGGTTTHHQKRKQLYLQHLAFVRPLPAAMAAGNRNGVDVQRDTLHVHTCFGRNRNIPLMRRPNTDSTPKKPITLQRNQNLIRYVGTSPVHTVTVRCYDTR
jgi:hypothetical protein